MPDFDVRPAAPADLSGIRRVALACWPVTYAGIFPPEFIDTFLERNYSEAALRRALEWTAASPVRRFDVAVDPGGAVLGFLQFGEGEHGPEVSRVYVLPAHFGQGIGTALFEALEAHMRAHGIARYGLFVHGLNELGKRFYIGKGLVHRPERDHAAENEWYMEKHLGG